MAGVCRDLTGNGQLDDYAINLGADPRCQLVSGCSVEGEEDIEVRRREMGRAKHCHGRRR
jgi:hypothetical protein